MQWKDVTLNISDKQRTRLKQLGAQFTDAMENKGLIKCDVPVSLTEELTEIINANTEVRANLKDAYENNNHYVLRLIDKDNEILNLPWPLVRETN
ncbi:MAG: hypothetical protein HQK92_16725, partial [Nitrospirae bacterium]|nr:hypothetical protein [Nitrospirota bacterium]